MFTGIIEAACPIASLTQRGQALRITLELPAHMQDGVKLGDSIAINGCCLTVAEMSGARVGFDAIPETLKLTNLGDLRQSSVVNLERALAAGARMDGHLVQGHVDQVGTVAAIKELDGEHRVTIQAGKDFCSQCVWKGSVCIDGISLTIAELTEETLTVAIIPHTWKVTNLHARKAGDRINLEADVIGKYVRRQLTQIFGAVNGMQAGLTQEMLKKHGFH